MASLRTIWRFTKRLLILLVVCLVILLGYGLSSDDYAKLDAFVQAERSWQTHPDFRHVSIEYARYAGTAMRTRPFGISSSRLLMALRSIPGLPERYAVAPTSQAHYTNFTRGPLSAYLHLCGEQGLSGVVGSIELMGQRSNLTDAEIRYFLISFNIYPEPATDAGAIASVRRMLADIDASRPLVIRENARDRLVPMIDATLRNMNLPTDLDRLTIDQQMLALQRLDDEVRKTDFELWRTKQLNDLLGGIWAQTFGLMYTWLVAPYLIAHRICRIGAPLLILALLARFLYQRRKRRAAAAAAASQAAPTEGQS